jgi:Bacterial conjugation TrbI-like protein
LFDSKAWLGALRREVPIKAKLAALIHRFVSYCRIKSGGKMVLVVRRLAPILGSLAFVAIITINWLMPKEDRTFYRHVTAKSDFQEQQDQPPQQSSAIANLFRAGAAARVAAEKRAAEAKKHKFVIKYRAPQIVGDGDDSKMKAGAKLIGFLMNPIDTRAQSKVRVRLPRGGEQGESEIEPGSILFGQFNYSGDGDRVQIVFSRLDSPSGTSKPINAVALDAKTFTPGIAGDEFTGNGEKIAAGIGFNMLSGMSDTLTDRESLGNAFNGVQAKPSMKNALLQGVSRASQDQANQAESNIEQTRSFVLVPEGKELIIELEEDFGK